MARKTGGTCNVLAIAISELTGNLGWGETFRFGHGPFGLEMKATGVSAATKKKEHTNIDPCDIGVSQG